MAPVRTCIGCRVRAAKPDLLRLAVTVAGSHRTVTPDPRGSAPGRGAHVHPTVDCLDLAVRRRAFTRALRAEAPLDLSGLRAYVEALPTGMAAQSTTHPASTTHNRKRSSRS